MMTGWWSQHSACAHHCKPLLAWGKVGADGWQWGGKPNGKTAQETLMISLGPQVYIFYFHFCSFYPQSFLGPNLNYWHQQHWWDGRQQETQWPKPTGAGQPPGGGGQGMGDKQWTTTTIRVDNKEAPTPCCCEWQDGNDRMTTRRGWKQGTPSTHHPWEGAKVGGTQSANGKADDSHMPPLCMWGGHLN